MVGCKYNGLARLNPAHYLLCHPARVCDLLGSYRTHARGRNRHHRYGFAVQGDEFDLVSGASVMDHHYPANTPACNPCSGKPLVRTTGSNPLIIVQLRAPDTLLRTSGPFGRLQRTRPLEPAACGRRVRLSVPPGYTSFQRCIHGRGNRRRTCLVEQRVAQLWPCFRGEPEVGEESCLPAGGGVAARQTDNR